MSKPDRLPRVLSQRTAKQLLEANGWTETLGGKHNVKMTKPAIGQSPCRTTAGATTRET